MKLEFSINDPKIVKFFEKQKDLIEKKTGEKKTNAEIAESLVHTGVFRRLAARRWAKKNPIPYVPKAKTAAAPKVAKKAKGPLARKKATAKPPAVRKAKRAAPTVAALAKHDAETSGATPATEID